MVTGIARSASRYVPSFLSSRRFGIPAARRFASYFLTLPCCLYYFLGLRKHTKTQSRAALVAGGNRSAAYLMEWLGLPTLESSNDPNRGEPANSSCKAGNALGSGAEENTRPSSVNAPSNAGSVNGDDAETTGPSEERSRNAGGAGENTRPSNVGDEIGNGNDSGPSQELVAAPPPLSPQVGESEAAAKSSEDSARDGSGIRGPVNVLPPEGAASEAASAAAAVAAALERGGGREKTHQPCSASSRSKLSLDGTSVGDENGAVPPSANGWNADPMDEDESGDGEPVAPPESSRNGKLSINGGGGDRGDSSWTTTVDRTKVGIAASRGDDCGGFAAAAAAPQSGDDAGMGANAGVTGRGFEASLLVAAAAVATEGERGAGNVRRACSPSSGSSCDSSAPTADFSSGAYGGHVSPPAVDPPAATASATFTAVVATSEASKYSRKCVEYSRTCAAPLAEGAASVIAKRKTGLREEDMPSPKRARTPEGMSPVEEGGGAAGVCWNSVKEAQVNR